MLVSTFAAFVAMCLLSAVVPGPNLLLVLRAHTLGGPTATNATIAGIGCGKLLWGIAAATGAALALENAPLLFVAMKVVGALYICTIGLRMMLGDERRTVEADDAPPSTVRSRHFVEGLVTCAFNPNSLLFYLAVFPQFLGDADGTVGIAMTLVLTSVLVDVAWFRAVARMLSRRSGDTRRARPWIAKALGTGLLGFGVVLIARI